MDIQGIVTTIVLLLMRFHNHPTNSINETRFFVPSPIHIAYRVFPEDTKSKNKVYLSAESDLARRAIKKAVSIFWFWSDIRGICTMPALYVVACRMPSSDKMFQ